MNVRKETVPPILFSLLLREIKVSCIMRNRSKAAIGFIFITILLDVIGFGIIIPVVPKLLSHMIQGTMSEASVYGGFLLFAYSLMQFLFSPVIGNLSDQYGRRLIILISLFGFGIDYLLTAFAPTIGWLFLGRIIAGITGASFTTASAYIADVSTPENKAQNFGMIGAAFGLGFIIGPVIGGLLGSYGPRVPFLAAATLTLLNWIYGYFILPESLPLEHRKKFSWRNANPVGSLLLLRKYSGLMGLVAGFFLIYLASHAVNSTWSYYSIVKFNWHEREVGISLGVVGVMVAFVQGFLMRKTLPLLGQEKSVYIGLSMYAIGMLLFAFATQGWMMYAFTVVYCLGGIAGPALQGIISNHIPPNEQGALQGAMTSLVSVTSIFGPLFMTALFSYFTGDSAPFHFPGAPFTVGAILMLLSVGFAYRSLFAERQAGMPNSDQ